MTVIKEYQCNFCHNKIKSEADGYGFNWFANKHGGILRLCETENHICNICLRALTEAGNKIL
jgi:hypothetical protein